MSNFLPTVPKGDKLRDFQWLEWFERLRKIVNTASSGSSPLTTKGDLYTYTTTNARLPIGTNTYVLTVNTITASGLEWQPMVGVWVPVTTTITTTLPLFGGGNLSTGLALGVNTFTSLASGVVPASGGGTVNYLRADGTWTNPTSGSALINWVEAVNTAAPNATIPVVSFLPNVGATANADAVLGPKGTGSILAAVPDNTATGGNKRGVGAVDWQGPGASHRTAATDVAGGDYSVIGGGQYNRIDPAPYSTVPGGRLNYIMAGAQYGTVGGGTANILGTAGLGTNAVIAGGASNTSENNNSWIPGGSQANTNKVPGAWAWANGVEVSNGDRQHWGCLLKQTTTNATPKIMTTSGTGTAATNNQAEVPNGRTSFFTCYISARNTGTGNGEAASFQIKGSLRRGAGVGSTFIDGITDVVSYGVHSTLAAASVAVSADTTFGALAVTVTGVAATNISWLCRVEMEQCGN